MKRNRSGLTPLGVAVLVEPYEPLGKEAKIVLPDSVRDRELSVESRAVVVEVGPEAWSSEKEPRAKPGDHVFITKYAGFATKGVLDGKPYRLINDRDVFCRIDPTEVAQS